MPSTRPCSPSGARCQAAARFIAALALAYALFGLPEAAIGQEEAHTGWLHAISIHRPGDADAVEHWLTDDQGARRLLLIDPDLVTARGGTRGLDRQRVS